MKKNIAIFGATGVVGRETLKMISEYHLNDNHFFLFASNKDSKRRLSIGRKKYDVCPTDLGILAKTKYDYALLCTREEVSKLITPILVETGCVVIDFSSYYRKDFPIIVPEINFCEAKGNLLCNPNCSTAGAVMALHNIHKLFGLKEIVYSTYQAVSGAGKLALDDMKTKKRERLKSFAYPICNNLIPQIGKLDEKGFSTEENKMIFETRKILGDKNIKISATCVRVPIDICHSESIHFKTRKNATLRQIRDAIKNSENVKLFDKDPDFPMPYFCRGQNAVLVGRIRESFDKNSFDIFICSDNLRKGASQNGVQILKALIERNK